MWRYAGKGEWEPMPFGLEGVDLSDPVLAGMFMAGVVPMHFLTREQIQTMYGEAPDE